MSLSISAVANHGYHLVILEGDVDTKTAPTLLAALTEINLELLNELRIEMEQVGFLSSAGLRTFLFAKQKMPYESRLILVGATDAVAEVIEKTGLSQAIMLASSHDAIT